MTKPSRAPVVLALLLALAGCGDRRADPDHVAGPATFVPAPSPGVTLKASDPTGLAIEGLALVRVAPDIVELRADLVNGGTSAAEVGSLRRALAGPAGPGAAALVTEDGGKQFYPLVRVDAGPAGKPQGVSSLEPGARSSLVIRFGPVAADVARLRPVVPGFAASALLVVAEDK